MRYLALITLALVATAPVAAQVQRQEQPRVFWAAQARDYGNCIVKADARGSLRYVRAAAGSAAANAARTALAPTLLKCEAALGAWAPHLREADRRNAVQAALVRTRNKQS
ncbi:hypothetical protein P1X14_18825 [Sphingomonas sp. AOB5]|uniref:hypothetical protein n=1 Tax=Sphingomonas sp. AOB5 TaxID=3034017 RepID=UPI0023F76E4C|nr:hypothetical protein [Sphingomonas sp. AOB5]MDF7777319.1 hypothetical protein [Sphingomonas sp. AOB5]